jgi:hypothetical protein
MKIGKWAKMVLAVAPLLAGCKGFWNPPAGSTGSGACTTNCTTATSGNFYILNSGTTPQVVGESIVAGKLTALSGSPYPVTGAPYTIAMGPGGSFLYVSSTSGIFLYSIGSGGVLGTATSVSGDNAYGLQVDPSGKWLVEALQVAGGAGVQLAAIPITSSGTNVAGATVPSVSYSIANTAVQLGQLVISPDGKYVLVALGTAGTIVVPFSETAPFPTGTNATTIPVLHTNGTALSVAVDPEPSPRLFYIGETLGNSASNSGGLRVFNYGSLGANTLTQVANSPFASGGLAPSSILPLASADYVYIANGQGTSSGNIAEFAITSTGSSSAPAYTVTAGSTAAAGTLPNDLAEDNTGTFLLGINSSGSPYFDSYTFDSTTVGLLDPQIFANTGATPVAVVSAPQ